MASDRSPDTSGSGLIRPGSRPPSIPLRPARRWVVNPGILGSSCCIENLEASFCCTGLDLQPLLPTAEAMRGVALSLSEICGIIDQHLRQATEDDIP